MTAAPPPPPRIVDMRSRPRWLHEFFGGGALGTPAFETVRWLNRRVGSRDPDHFARAGDLPAFLAEMDEAGIDRAVVCARSVPGVRVANEDIAALVRAAPGRLIGVASVDPVELGPAGALEAARHAVATLGLSAVNLDCGFWAEPMRADDERLMPLYALCQQLGVPAFVMSGPTTPNLAFNDPLAVDAVARTFPTLPIVCCHGFWPRVDDMLAVAFRHENVLVSPDMYLFAPGGGRYVEAANAGGFLARQLLFGSSYPFRPMAQGVADLRALGLAPEPLSLVLGGNAARLFRLDAPAQETTR
jgi:predicted TIM-barrel fold metal-dependent hydrolase